MATICYLGPKPWPTISLQQSWQLLMASHFHHRTHPPTYCDVFWTSAVVFSELTRLFHWSWSTTSQPMSPPSCLPWHKYIGSYSWCSWSGLFPPPQTVVLPLSRPTGLLQACLGHGPWRCCGALRWKVWRALGLRGTRWWAPWTLRNDTGGWVGGGWGMVSWWWVDDGWWWLEMVQANDG